MPITISTVEEFQVTRFGPRIVELTTLLNLPLPTIMVHPLTKFERKDLWGFKVNQPGRQTEPTTDPFLYKGGILHLLKAPNHVKHANKIRGV